MARRQWVARIPVEVADWFDEHFPPGSHQWFLEGCVTKLHQLYKEGHVETPVDLLDQVVRDQITD